MDQHLTCHPWVWPWFLLLSKSKLFFIQGGNTGTYRRRVLLHQTVHKIPFPNMLACTPINYHQYKKSKHRKVGIKFEYHFCETKLALETKFLKSKPNTHLHHLLFYVNEWQRGLMLHTSDWHITSLNTFLSWQVYFIIRTPMSVV